MIEKNPWAHGIEQKQEKLKSSFVNQLEDKIQKKKITKKGSIMMFATIQDTSGTMELLIFPKT